MSAVKITVRIYHFRFKPKPEAHTERIYFIGKTPKSVRQSVGVFHPIAQSRVIGYSLAEPAVVEHHCVNSYLRSLFRNFNKLFLVKIKIGGFPVVYKHKPLGIAVFAPAKPCAVKLMINSRHFADTVCGIHKNRLGSAEGIVPFKRVGKLKRIYTDICARGIVCVQLNARNEISAVNQAEAVNIALRFGSVL